jgi:hypothetical protein
MAGLCQLIVAINGDESYVFLPLPTIDILYILKLGWKPKYTDGNRAI